jgi:hypothetical protein
MGYIFFCILGCIISLLDWVVEFVNRYAFVSIALYGKSYFAAAKDTWRLIKDRGIDALVNLCLVGPVLSFGALFVAFVTALLSYVYILFTDPPYNSVGFICELCRQLLTMTLEWRIHTSGRCLQLLDWHADLQHCHDPYLKWYRHNLRGVCLV